MPKFSTELYQILLLSLFDSEFVSMWLVSDPFCLLPISLFRNLSIYQTYNDAGHSSLVVEITCSSVDIALRCQRYKIIINIETATIFGEFVTFENILIAKKSCRASSDFSDFDFFFFNFFWFHLLISAQMWYNKTSVQNFSYHWSLWLASETDNEKSSVQLN